MAKIEIKSYRKERERDIQKKLWKNMGTVGAVVERQAKINVTKSGSEHPQVKSGRLRSSILHWVFREGDNIAVSIGSHVNYAKHLEHGTEKMPAYPWLFPAVESKRGRIAELLAGTGFSVEERE